MGRPISKCQCREHCKARIVKGSGVYLAEGHEPSVKGSVTECRCGCGGPVFTHNGYARGHDPAIKHLLSTNVGDEFPSRSPEARAKISAYQKAALANGTHVSQRPERNAKISAKHQASVKAGTYHMSRPEVRQKVSATLRSHGENHSSKRPEMRILSSRNYSNRSWRTPATETKVYALLDHSVFDHTGQKSASQYGAPISFDIVCRQLRLGILIHGCHWHACPDHSKPSERAELKRTRDAMLADHARKEGWTVLTVWEHEINTDLTSVVARINNTFASLRTDMKDG